MERWQAIESAYHRARELDLEARAQFLAETCAQDSAMRRQVEQLLAQDEARLSLLDRLPFQWAIRSTRVAGDAVLTGSQIGVYQVLELIGSGGMGDVYRARDTVLDRHVALKALHSPLAADPEGRARFQREAQMLASLNHPNIAAIYGFEEASGVLVLALELVEGLTLADRIANGPVPLDEALAIARQVVDALEAAHERRIVHRDLKPANIKVRPDGAVKILDFGLAKALQPTMSAADEACAALAIMRGPRLTTSGALLGTAAYMSPEQVNGHDVDKRSDVWAFGCLLFEMLTGQRAFRGDDVGDTLAAVVRDEPDWSAWPESVPPHIRALVEACLQKDPRERVADISTARFVISDRHIPLAADMPAARRRRGPRVLLFGAMMSIAATIGAVVAWRMKPATNDAAPAVTRFSIALGENQQFTNSGRTLVAISPDGSHLVYVANQRLYLRRMSEPEVRPIPGSETAAGVTNPVFSPDGQYIAFWSTADRTLKRIAITGGTAFTICQAGPLFGMSWGPDGILFGQADKGIMRVRADGGTPELLVGVKNGELVSDPQTLPDDRGTLFTVASGARGAELWDAARIVVQSPRGTEPQTLIEGGSGARYFSTGHIVYAVDGRLFAVAFDLRTLKVLSRPVPVLDGVARSPNTPVAQFAVSNTGTLVYIPGPASAFTHPRFHLGLLDRLGKVQVLKLPAGEYESPRVSPDGTQLAFGVGDYRQSDIWIYELAGASAMRRLTFGGTNRFPVWSADGRYIAFQSDRDGDRAGFRQRADVSGNAAERLTKPEPGSSYIPESWSVDDVLLYSVYSDKSRRFTLSSFSLREKRASLLEGIESALPLASEFSSDGRWFSYNPSDRDFGPAQATVFVEPFPRTGAKYQISEPHRGFHPVWLPDDNALSYSTGISPDGPQWVIARITRQPRFAVGSVMKVSNGGLVDSVPSGPVNERNYDFTPDGGRIGLIPAERTVGLFATDPASAARSIPIHVVLNWFDELRQRTAAHTP